MKIKPLDRRGQENLKLSMSKMIKVKKQDIDYYIFAMKVKEIDKFYLLMKIIALLLIIMKRVSL